MAKLHAQENHQIKKSFWTPKRMARIAILIALSGVGALIKLPSPTGTVALDSAPGYFTAAAFGPIEGGLVAGLGHLFTAATTGFPLGIPMHLLVGVEQAAWAFIFWILVRRINLTVAIIGATFFNGVVASAIMIPIGGVGMFVGLLLPMIVGSAINVLIAAAAYKIVQKSNLI